MMKSLNQAQQLMQRLRFGEDCDLVILGDSLGDSSIEWAYLLSVKLAIDYSSHTVEYRVWDVPSNTYGAVTKIQNGAGNPTLRIWNASISAATPTKLIGQYLWSINPSYKAPDCILISHGHTGEDDFELQYSMLATLTGEVSRLLPFSPIVLIGQPRNISNDSMNSKVIAFKALAESKNFGFIDAHAFFNSLAAPIAGYYYDNKHPNSVGSHLLASFIHSAFRYEDGLVGSVGLSGLSTGPIVFQSSYADLSDWDKSSGLMVQEDTTEFETSGSSTKFTGANIGSSEYIQKDVITSNDIRVYRGRPVSFTARIKVPLGSNLNVGRIALDDGVNSKITTTGGPQGTAFYTQAIHMRIDPSANFLRAIIYLSTSGGTTENLWVDRITVSDGPHPMDIVYPG